MTSKQDKAPEQPEKAAGQTLGPDQKASDLNPTVVSRDAAHGVDNPVETNSQVKEEDDPRAAENARLGAEIRAVMEAHKGRRGSEGALQDRRDALRRELEDVERELALAGRPRDLSVELKSVLEKF